MRIPTGVYLGVVALSVGIADRLIFVPPPSTYDEGLEGLVRFTSDRGDTIAARWVEGEPGRPVVLFAHGNAEDIGLGGWHAERYAESGVSILAFDYPGYGLSTGTPSEEGAYSAADAALAWLLRTTGVDEDRVLLHGRSLGGAVMVELASRAPIGGLVIESSFVSAYRVLTRYRVLPTDPFPSLARLPEVAAPVLVIHGDRDAVIAPWHGRRLYEAIPDERRSALWVEGAGHNDLAFVAGDAYWDALAAFVVRVEGRGDT